MKSIHVDFVASHWWRAVWVAGALAATAILVTTAFLAWQWRQTDALFSVKIAQTSLALLQLKQQSKLPPDTMLAAKLQASKLLTSDLNGAFATIEGLRLEGIRLISISLDSSSGEVRLEYGMDSVSRSVEVTAALNSGYESRPWKFRSVGGTPNGAAPSIALARSAVRAVWTAKLEAI